MIASWTAPLRYLADVALPPRCPGCGAIVGEDHRFCAACWGGLRFLGPPACAACAAPFPYDHGAAALCAACHRDPPAHAGIFGAVAYADVPRAVALKLKYGGRLGLAETAARQMRRLVPADTNLLIPVPLHRRRLWSRGYNQAALMAAALGRDCGLAVRPDILVRRRPTAILRGLDAAARARAVRGAFTVEQAGTCVIAGRSIALVDDVVASGATADACTRALLRAGAARVAVVCWARVIDDAVD